MELSSRVRLGVVYHFESEEIKIKIFIRKNVIVNQLTKWYQ